MHPTPTELDLVVIGGGITGLAAAYEAHRKSQRVVLLEKSAELGGVAQTAHVEGYLCERGPNSLLTRPAFATLISELGIPLADARPEAKKRFLVHPDRPELIGVKPHPSTLMTLPFALPFAKIQTVRRLLAEPFLKPTTLDDESVASFIDRHFGESLRRLIFKPVLAGIYAADIERLSARSALKSLWELDQTYGSIIRGSRLKKKGTPPTPRLRAVAFRNGIQELITRIAQELEPESIRLRSPVTAISFSEDGVTVHGESFTFRAKRVIVATDSTTAANFISAFDRELAAALLEIPYAPVGILHLGVKRSDITHPLDGFGFLQGPRPNDPVLGAIFSSALFENRAPQGFELITCICGGMGNPHLADVRDESITERAIQRLSQLLGIQSRPTILLKTHWARAIPNYAIGHHKTVESLKRFENDHPGIKFAGNWVDGVSVPDCIEQGRAAVLDTLDSEAAC